MAMLESVEIRTDDQEYKAKCCDNSDGPLVFLQHSANDWLVFPANRWPDIQAIADAAIAGFKKLQEETTDE